MEYSGIGKVKDEFVPRKSYEDFHRDGEVIEELYMFTARLMTRNLGIPLGGHTLQVFNHAYRIFWMFLEGKRSARMIDSDIEFENDSVRNYAWAVVYALYRLNNRFNPPSTSLRIKLVMKNSEGVLRKEYRDFVKDKELLHPIDFRAPICMPEPVTDLTQARNYVVAAIDKAIDLEEENKRLHEQLDDLLETFNHYRHHIKELQEQNALLQQKVNKLENDELCKVVNLESIAKYGLRQTHPKTIQVIVNMLNRLCVSKGCVPEPLRNRIEELEEHICVLESPQPSIQNNHGCQQFYGNVTDSEFPIQ